MGAWYDVDRDRFATGSVVEKAAGRFQFDSSARMVTTLAREARSTHYSPSLPQRHFSSHCQQPVTPSEVRASSSPPELLPGSCIPAWTGVSGGQGRWVWECPHVAHGVTIPQSSLLGLVNVLAKVPADRLCKDKWNIDHSTRSSPGVCRHPQPLRTG